jgi:hypothetical protein
MVESNYALSREERRFLQDLADTPEDGRLLEFVADRSLPAAIRAETPLTTMVTAACRSPREMMFGLSSARRAAFEEMMTAISDIPRMAEMTPFMRRALETFESPERFLAGLNAPRSNDAAHTVPLLLVPSSLRARVEFCRDQGL